MKCKDCACADVCYYKAFNDVRSVKRRNDVEKVCKSFVNRDAVEVVRCKDCKHWFKDVPGCTDTVGRCKWANYMIGAVGYCVYGERKDND